MAMIQIPNAGKMAFAQGFIIPWIGPGSTNGAVRLFKADIDIDNDSVLADFDDEEADFPGYAGQNLAAASLAVVGNIARITFAAASFIMNDDSPSNTIYGYYIKGSWVSGTYLYWAEKFTTPVEMDHDGAELLFVPRLDIDQIGS